MKKKSGILVNNLKRVCILLIMHNFSGIVLQPCCYKIAKYKVNIFVTFSCIDPSYGFTRGGYFSVPLMTMGATK